MPPSLASPPRRHASRILGSVTELRRSQVQTYERAMREQGDVVRLPIGPPGLRIDLYVAFHPDGVQHVLAGKRGRYTKANRFYREIAANIGMGLLTSEGARWEHQRRLIQPLFTRRQTAGYAELMAEEAATLADRWATGPETVDVHEEMIHLTLRIGRPRDLRRRRRSRRRRAAMGVPGGHRKHVPARHGTGRAAGLVAAARERPGRARPPCAVRGRGRADRAPQGDRGRRGRPAVAAAGVARRRHRRGDGRPAGARRGARLPAGRPRTTSTALTFTLHLLGRHPDEQEQVHAELVEVLDGRPPTAQDAHALERTTMVVKESMRLYPPAYATGRRAEIDDELGGYRIPAGAELAVSPWATHRHPRFWDDPERFDPERFTPERESDRHPYAYFPFGRGPRACIGSNFAMLESLIAVAVLVRRFRIEAPPDPVALDTAGITMRPKGPVPIRLARR